MSIDVGVLQCSPLFLLTLVHFITAWEQVCNTLQGAAQTDYCLFNLVIVCVCKKQAKEMIAVLMGQHVAALVQNHKQ